MDQQLALGLRRCDPTLPPEETASLATMLWYYKFRDRTTLPGTTLKMSHPSAQVGQLDFSEFAGALQEARH
eukprot:2243167-Pyramimonas_sp.AAC.1